MVERYPTSPEAHERPSLPRSAWSLESLDLHNTKPIRQREPQENGLSLEKYILQFSYRSRMPRTLTSTQLTPQYHFEQLQRGHDRKARVKHQQVSNEDEMQAKCILPALHGDRTRWRKSMELRPRAYSSSFQRSQSKYGISRARHPNRRPSHHEGSRRSYSNRRRSRRQRNQQLRAPSYTIFQWFLWKLSCGSYVRLA